MNISKNLSNALISGTIVGLATFVAGSVYAASARISPVAPTNAVSHIIWGDNAMKKNQLDLKHTGTGAMLHYLSAIWWAFWYEWGFGEQAEKKGVVKAMEGGAIISSLAYLIDYHILPKRLSPGFEARLPSNSLPIMFGVIGLTLPLRAIFNHMRS